MEDGVANAAGAGRVQPLDTVRAIAERVARARGLEVWDIQSRRESGSHVVRIFIDRPGPAATPEESVSVEDCEQVNRELSTILDVEDPLPFAYVLEVSSPGLDRPLRSTDDYVRFAGRLAKILVSEPVDGPVHFEGRLGGFDNGAIVIETTPGKRQRIPLPLVKRAHLEVEF